MKLKVDAHLWCLGTYAERYVPGGYYEDMKLEEKLEAFSKIDGLTGLVVFYPTEPLPSDPDKLLKLLENYNLKVSVMEPEVWSDRKYRDGAFSSTDSKIRKEAIKRLKESIDLGKALKAESVLLWPAHDGFDYPFQCDYSLAWQNFVETVREIGEYDRTVKIAIEAKSKDPRQKQLISDTGKALAFINDVGLDNIGCALDVGHALMAGESLAESLMLIDMHKKLFQIHLNDNYKDADPDMVLGTVNFWEILEFFYFLNKTDYQSWSTIDIISSRDDRFKTLELAVKMTWQMKELADKLSMRSDEIDSNLKGYRFADNMNIITDMLFK
ncbi:MAG: TIM barrel protein [Actinobacteria bacterium]|nr:TIM barrel protein [Actinomycetota bacterium]